MGSKAPEHGTPKPPKTPAGNQSGRRFDLRKPEDLFAKLERDYGQLEENPLSMDAAFNFTVTAHQLGDWRFPGNDAARKTECHPEDFTPYL